MGGDAIAAMHRIGYTDAVPEVPQWLSAEAKDFLGLCLVRKASDRCTAAQLLELPFLASAVAGAKLQSVEGKWVSPKSTLDAALWESDSDSEEADDDELSHSTAKRIKALACPASALPDWDSEDGWIDVLSAASTQTQDAVAVPAVETAADLHSTISREEASGAETVVPCISAHSHRHKSLEDLDCQELLCKPIFCSKSSAIDVVSVHKTLCSVLHLCFSTHIASSTLHCDTFDK
jgi:serine/threonine protein kinase